MYLVKIDPDTGLVSEKDEDDGWKTVESFRDLVNKKGYGIKALTVVALVVDYGSPIKNYSEKERPLRAQEIVLNSRTAILWNCDEIQLACINYSKLQYNAVLEEKKIIDNLRADKIEEIKDTPENNLKAAKLKELSAINLMHDAFEIKHNQKDLFAESPVRNGYKLSRLEIKLLDKKSFYHEKEKKRRDAENRDKENSISSKE